MSHSTNGRRSGGRLGPKYSGPGNCSLSTTPSRLDSEVFAVLEAEPVDRPVKYAPDDVLADAVSAVRLLLFVEIEGSDDERESGVGVRASPGCCPDEGEVVLLKIEWTAGDGAARE
jgi:hypothetical protein